jgi:hypothetical protein
MYLSITGVKNNKLTKYQPFETEAEAIAHAKEYSGFVVEDIGGNQEFWIVDKDKKTITFDQARWDSHQKAITSTQYQRDRKESYPPATDYLDGVVKGDQAQIDKYVSDCLAIKDKYPK